MKLKVKAVIDDTLASLKASGQLAFDVVPNFNIEVPKSLEHGDWSCNVALTLAKAAGKKPHEVADLIIKHLVDRAAIVVSVEKAGPGFLNFRLRDQVFQQIAREVLKAGATFGRLPPRSTGRKVLVEFVSANPTGPVHLGHARGAFMGDAVARLLTAAGHEVTREFYINDFGKQVETLGRTIFKRYQALHGAAIELLPGEYPGAYVIEIAKAWKAEVGDAFMGKDEAEYLPAAMQVGIRENLAAIRRTLAQANVEHDAFFSERSLHESGKVRAIVDVYRGRGGDVRGR
jgi:arginyl-tRNA synthetase